MESKINIFKNKDVLIQESAKYITHLTNDILREKAECTLVLAGGSTPKGLYKTLASEPYKNNIDWSKVHLYWGDERCVPPEHPDSNYRMAKEALIDHIDIPQKNVHRIPAEKEPSEAAREYEKTIKRSFGGTSHLPVFDIILLGIGEDGHTASLFPGTDVIDEKVRWVKEVYVSQLDTHRITMTFPVINNGRNVIFLVAGEAKVGVVKSLIKNQDLSYPASMVKPVHGNMVCMLDKEASLELSTE